LCKLSFPIVGLKMSSLPTWALKSLNKIFMWYLGNLSINQSINLICSKKSIIGDTTSGYRTSQYQTYIRQNKHTFQFFVESVLHIISFIFCLNMNVQNTSDLLVLYATSYH
jgi:hypothetical protein